MASLGPVSRLSDLQLLDSKGHELNHLVFIFAPISNGTYELYPDMELIIYLPAFG